MANDDMGHGNSLAAWTAVSVMLIGITAGSLFFWFELPVLVWVSVGVVALGPIVGAVLARMGYGVNGKAALPQAE